jgi:oxygen-independent coproporphyrinogen-3 oxidase
MIEEANNNHPTLGDAVIGLVTTVGKLAASPAEPIRHLYVHIPFCARICPYCAFYKELLDRSELSRFCEALLRELKQYAQQRNFAPSTIYFGGGTPTTLSTAHLRMLLEGFHAQLDLSQVTEWTLEANPGSVSWRKAALLRESGVNRMSLGVQSWNDDLLLLLGREHNAAQAEESFHILRDAGFTNINIDLMCGLPGQTIQQWRETLGQTIALRPEHISAYCLTYEEDTDFFLRHARGEFRQDPEADAELFDLTMSMLEDVGYRQYEISNYARSGFESAHNRTYWSGDDYLGIGPSAFSTLGLCRWQNVANYRDYSARILRGESVIEATEQLTPQTKRNERIALGLRTRHGVRAQELGQSRDATDELVALGLLEASNGSFVLTRKGKSLADSVAEALL